VEQVEAVGAGQFVGGGEAAGLDPAGDGGFVDVEDAGGFFGADEIAEGMDGHEELPLHVLVCIATTFGCVGVSVCR